METLAHADPFLTKAALASAAHQYLGSQDPRDPQASPFYGNLKGLPPIRVDVGEDEILPMTADAMPSESRWRMARFRSTPGRACRMFSPPTWACYMPPMRH